ncbi:transcriptional regulator, IclR family [Roseovarius pacificus]|uniref:Transcriptional regulator, IclR family n=1 Tax=Roseovarius pacificus TaxID=337701 RepID=A0A1M6Y786_9RHOB|nr:IclR family transcriptional regulator [Roseovarius pacificus]GGO51244.1 IclR family transcriptional regulator [Roseovarius pacificus]SHL14150.1 transcriptional regulator, IclR family [Roseovarius pacificus]
MPTLDADSGRRAETSLAKAIRLLPIVAERNATGVNLSTVARKANLTTATARRLLQGLVDGGLLSFDPYSKIYTLGIGLFDLAGAPGSPRQFDAVRMELHPALAETATVTGETVYLTVPFGDEALCIDAVIGTTPLRANTLQVGSRRPLGVGAGSAAILAALPENSCDRLISSNSEVYGRYGDLSTAEVRSMVRHWRKHRYLVNNSLIIPDVSAIAVAVFDGSDRLLAALSVSARKSRMGPQRRKEIVAVMEQALNRAGLKT